MPILLDLLAVALASQQTAVVANPLPNAKFDISERMVVPLCQPLVSTVYHNSITNPQAIGKGIVGDLYCKGNEQGPHPNPHYS